MSYTYVTSQPAYPPAQSVTYSPIKALPLRQISSTVQDAPSMRESYAQGHYLGGPPCQPCQPCPPCPPQQWNGQWAGQGFH